MAIGEADLRSAAEVTYLDWNATAPILPEAAAAVAEALAAGGNPSSVHAIGRAARRRVETARAEVAALVGADPDRVIFTSGATEANQLAVAGSGCARLVASAVEHPSILEAGGADREPPVLAAVTVQGTLDLRHVAGLLAPGAGRTLLSVMAANNETGIIQPVAAAAGIARGAGALVHCDAVQAVGRLPLDIAELGVHLLSLSAHKIGGPPGVGALVLAPGIEVDRQLHGGGQERGRRGGTENVAGIAGFGVAARLARKRIAAMERVGALRDRLEAEACARVPWAQVIGADVPRLANTSCLVLPGVPADTQIMALDLAGIAASAGAACSSGKVRRSHVLLAMGLEDAVAGSAVRISLGPETPERAVDRFLEAWCELARRWAVRRPAA